MVFPFRKSPAKSRLPAFAALGSRTFIDPTAQFLGAQRIAIGHDTVIGEHSWLNVNNFSTAEPSLIIGNFCLLGRRAFLTSGRLLKIGDYCLTGPDVHFLGADHGIADPLRPYLSNPVEAEESLTVGPNCWLGSGVRVLSGLQIGHGCVIGAGAVVTKSLPPFSLAVGNPARVIKRYDFTTGAWVASDQLDASALRRMPDEADYLDQLRNNVPHLKIPAIAASRSLGNL